MKTYVKKTKAMGRGVFSGKVFKPGEIIEVSQCITMDPKYSKVLQDTSLRFYVFSDDKDSSVIALGIGSLFNHQGLKANVTYTYDPKTETIVFKATRRIKVDEQLFINYGYDPVRKMQEWTEEQEYLAKAEARERRRLRRAWSDGIEGELRK